MEPSRGRTAPARSLPFRSPRLRPLEDLLVRGELGRVVQPRQLADSVARECAPDQEIGQVRVLGQQRSVEVGADDRTLKASLRTVGAVVARAGADLSQRPGRW